MTPGSWPALGPSYDAVAPAYEARFLDELAGKPRDRELLTDLAGGVGGGRPVLDVGCGPGQVGAFVRALGPTVVGVDLSPVMARLAAGRLDGGVTADLARLPFPAGSIGGAVAFYSLIHLRRDLLVPAVAELARVLAPGARLLATFHEGEGELRADEFLGSPVPFVATMFGLEEVVSAFGAGGLRVERAERRPPYETEGPTVRLAVGATRP